VVGKVVLRWTSVFQGGLCGSRQMRFYSQNSLVLCIIGNASLLLKQTNEQTNLSKSTDIQKLNWGLQHVGYLRA
jgi:hypothetical protein